MTMGYAGTASIAFDGALQLMADDSIVVALSRDSAIRVRRDTRHRITLKRDDRMLVLRFESGAEHRLERVGDGVGDVHLMEEGAIALVDDRFILVASHADRTTLGHGAQHDARRTRTMHVAYSIDVVGTNREYQRDVPVSATFDNEVVVLNGNHQLHLK